MAETTKETKFERETEQWTDTWALISSNPMVGQKILKAMQAFVTVLGGRGLPDTILNRHVFNLWLLCGEISSYVRDDEILIGLSPDELMLRFVDAEGGPYCAKLTNEQEQRSFDATCRKLFRYLTMPTTED